MYVSALSLHDFRSYKELVLEFEPGVTCFYGANGQGKTNIVEAIGYLSNLNSHRVGMDKTLLRWKQEREENADSATIRAKIVRENRPSLLELEIVAGRANRARIKGNNVRTRELLSQLVSVIFAPEDLALVRGEPAVRRQFIDQLVLASKPGMAQVYTSHAQSLKQRAALLKMGVKTGFLDRGELEVWNAQTFPLAAKIMTERKEILKILQKHLDPIYREVSSQAQNSEARIVWAVNQYLTKNMIREESGEEEILQALNTAAPLVFENEKRRGVNLIGCHRDEIEFKLRDYPVRGYASHGETWSYVLALKLACLQFLTKNLGETPILILDDVFAELDENRRLALLGAVKNTEQVFITTAVRSDVPTELKAKFLKVEMGEVEGNKSTDKMELPLTEPGELSKPGKETEPDPSKPVDSTEVSEKTETKPVLQTEKINE